MQSFNAGMPARIQLACTVQPRVIPAARGVGTVSGMVMAHPSGSNWGPFSEAGLPFFQHRVPHSVTIGELAAPDKSLAFLAVGACWAVRQKADAAAGCH